MLEIGMICAEAGEKIAMGVCEHGNWQRIWKCVPAPQRPPARIAALAKEVFLRSSWRAGGGGRFTDSEVQAYKRDEEYYDPHGTSFR